MTLPESDELLILAYEALENRARFDKELPDFPLFRSEWSAVHIESHGSHILSFWRGPGTEMMALLTQGQPPERTLAAVDHRPCARKPRIEPTEGSFLLPGVPFGSPRGNISSFGIFAGWWPCETDAKRLRLTRRGKVSEIEAASDGFMLVDWNSPAAVERFDAVEIGKTGWTPTVVPAVPFTGDHLFRSYQRFRLSGVDWGNENPDL